MAAKRPRSRGWQAGVMLAVLVAASALSASRAPAASPPAPTGAPRIITQPLSPTNSTDATFTFELLGGGVVFQCSLDGGVFKPCASPKTYRDLSSTAHTFKVAAQFSVNSSLSPRTTRSWIVDRTPPAVFYMFPANNAVLTPAQWANGCLTQGVCGSASDAIGVTTVTATLQSLATSKYWNGAAFASSTAVPLTAAGTTKWRLALPMLSDGPYITTVTATDTVGNRGSSSRTFRMDGTPPSAPAITQTPEDATTGSSATFRFTTPVDSSQPGESGDGHSGVATLCSIDSEAFANCTSPKTYQRLRVGQHCFKVLAVDRLGNRSTETSTCWFVIVATGFVISGNAVAPLSPGTPTAVDVRIDNPYPFALKVLTVGITFHSTQPGCADSNFQLTPLSLRSLNSLTVVAANSFGQLSTLGLPDRTLWPQVRLVETNLSQNSCLGARITLTYSGTATKA